MKEEEWGAIKEQAAEANEDMLFCDGLEGAFLGICRRFGREPIALYDYHKCIEIRMEDGGTYEEASEFHEYNTMGAWVGENTPAFLVRLEDSPLPAPAITALDCLSGDQRLEVFSRYCTHCGRVLSKQDPCPCQCWSDE